MKSTESSGLLMPDKFASQIKTGENPFHSRYIFLITALFLISLNTLAQTTVKDRIRRVENSLTENIQINGSKAMNLQECMKHYKVNGLSIAVIRNYKVDFAKAYGMADSAKKVPVTDQTLFQAASISKSLNALAIMNCLRTATSICMLISTII